MSSLARIALGTVQPQARCQPMVWALLDLLSRRGMQVQHYLSRACFPPWDAAAAVTGQCSRHLDTWLMSADICRELFDRGTSSADLGLVEGSYLDDCTPGVAAGQLDDLCRWLDLARLAIVDVRHVAPCKLPPRPMELDGVLLDCSTSADQTRMAMLFETLWGVPVLGCLELSDSLRTAAEELRGGDQPARELCRQLGNRLLPNLRLDELLRMANRGPLVCGSQLFRSCDEDRAVCVAVAYDAAFHCYFPDTLDLLESRGATVVDFSPLRDESLPAGTDVVYFGCGHPERHAAELAGNHCMLAALRNHVCAGKRLYAEGGGLAYLCSQIETPDGDRVPMVGAFPMTARLNREPWTPVAYEARLATENWLGHAGAPLRGYFNAAWLLDAASELTPCLADPMRPAELVARHHALGSRLHLNFAAQPEALARFLRPHAPSLGWQCRDT